MHVGAAAGKMRKRLRHKRGDNPVFECDRAAGFPEAHLVVGGLKRIVIAVNNFNLSTAVFRIILLNGQSLISERTNNVQHNIVLFIHPFGGKTKAVVKWDQSTGFIAF